MKVKLANDSALWKALVYCVLVELLGEAEDDVYGGLPGPSYDGWSVSTDGAVTVENDGNWLEWPGAGCVAEALRLGAYAARHGETWGLSWTVDDHTLVIEGTRHALDQALYWAWRKQVPNGDVLGFRAWKRNTFGGVEPLQYETQEKEWAWFETMDEHILDIAQDVCLALLRAEARGERPPQEAVAGLQRLAKSSWSRQWLFLTALEDATLGAIDLAEVDANNAFAIGHAITQAQLKV